MNSFQIFKKSNDLINYFIQQNLHIFNSNILRPYEKFLKIGKMIRKIRVHSATFFFEKTYPS